LQKVKEGKGGSIQGVEGLKDSRMKDPRMKDPRMKDPRVKVFLVATWPRRARRARKRDRSDNRRSGNCRFIERSPQNKSTIDNYQIENLRMPVPLARALSKLGILSRARAVAAIRAGRVRVDGISILDPALPIVPETARIELDGKRRQRTSWRTILFHKPRGVVTTRRDPEGRKTIFDCLGEAGDGLIAVGRLDLASSGLLLLTTDTALADRITDPSSQVPRVYLVTVRGRVTDAEAARMTTGITCGRDLLRAERVQVRKVSTRESHLVVELRDGRNREIRRLCEAVGHDVTRLKRVSLGGLELGDLLPGSWRPVTRVETESVFVTSARRGGGIW
jgi:23S rRNA pseudouridine2605 synthase